MKKSTYGIRALVVSCFAFSTVFPLFQGMSANAAGLSNAAVEAKVEQKALIARYRITGQGVFPEEELVALVADKKGELTLADLERQAEKITRYFRVKGYLAAFAFVPEQDFQNGTAEIAVRTGKYDKIIIRNSSSVGETVIRREMGPALNSGEYIRKQELERAVWLIGDLAGVEAKASLEPGSSDGTANLIMTVKPKGKRISGSVTVDNYGSIYTGKNQLSLAALVRNPANTGDILSLRVLRSNADLSSGSISYTFPALQQGNKLGISYAKSYYTLGENYAELDANGESGTASVFWNHIMRRSPQANLYGQIRFDDKRLIDRIESFGTETKKKAAILTYSVNGDGLDDWGGGGANSFSLSAAAGRLSFQDDASRESDENTARTSGSFQKYGLTAMRRQFISERLSLLVSVNAQWAGKNLDSSEKLSLGGPYGVRAFAQGEASGDEGYLASSELRWEIPLAGQKDSLQFISFYDRGEVRVNKEKWQGDTSPVHRSLSGVGVGLDYSQQDNFAIRASYAWRLGSSTDSSETDNGRAWLQFVKYY